MIVLTIQVGNIPPSALRKIGVLEYSFIKLFMDQYLSKPGVELWNNAAPGGIFSKIILGIIFTSSVYINKVKVNMVEAKAIIERKN